MIGKHIFAYPLPLRTFEKCIDGILTLAENYQLDFLTLLAYLLKDLLLNKVIR